MIQVPTDVFLFSTILQRANKPERAVRCINPPPFFVFIRAFDDLYRENKGCCEHATSGVLVWKPIIVTKQFSQECLLKAL